MGADRFTRSILDGTIGSVEELKAAFREEAKRAHPDLADADGHEGFLKLRAEYERALRELSRESRAVAREEEAGAPREAADPPAALEILLKRGFPKRPRHRKEALRYGYARVRARSALGSADPRLADLFAAMEEELLAGPADAAERVVALLGAFLKAERAGAAALSAAVRMELGRLFPPVPLGGGAPKGKAAAGGTAAPRAASGAETRPGPAAEAFCRALFDCGFRR